MKFSVKIFSQRRGSYMSRHGENIYKRKDGRWVGRYIIGYDIENKALTGDVYGKTYKEAKEKLALAKVNAKKEQKPVSSDLTVKQWFEKWLASQRIKRSSYTTYYSCINKHINTKLGKIQKVSAMRLRMLRLCLRKWQSLRTEARWKRICRRMLSLMTNRRLLKIFLLKRYPYLRNSKKLCFLQNRQKVSGTAVRFGRLNSPMTLENS